MSAASKLLEEDVWSISDLIHAKRTAADAVRFRELIRDLPNWSTRNLLPRIETTRDPLTLWVLHLELDKRNIPPCLRLPSHQLGPQGDYISLTADIKWLMRMQPNHQAVFRGWRQAFQSTPKRGKWHDHVHRQFLFIYPRGLAYLGAKGLGLTEHQRSELLTLPTARMAKVRANLEGERFRHLFDRLHQYACAHPDKSGTLKPGQIAQRRAFIYRTYVLADRSPTLAADYWERISGERITRQAISTQIEGVKRALQWDM